MAFTKNKATAKYQVPTPHMEHYGQSLLTSTMRFLQDSSGYKNNTKQSFLIAIHYF